MEGPSTGRPDGSALRRWLPLVLAGAGIAALALARVAPPEPDPVPPAVSASGDHSGSSSSRQPPARHSATPHQQRPEAIADRLHGPRLPASDPVAIRVPALGLDAPLSRLELAADGTLEAPQAADEVGWFSGSVTPGAVGPAVIAGHVTWNGVPAPFYELATLDRGDKVLVRRQDGRVAVFAVTSVERFAKTHFPTQAVYGPTSYAALRLITCGGRFDVGRRRYADNVVAFGRMVAVRQ